MAEHSRFVDVAQGVRRLFSREVDSASPPLRRRMKLIDRNAFSHRRDHVECEERFITPRRADENGEPGGQEALQHPSRWSAWGVSEWKQQPPVFLERSRSAFIFFVVGHESFASGFASVLPSNLRVSQSDPRASHSPEKDNVWLWALAILAVAIA